MSENSFDVERAVRERYSEAARSRTEELCCPVKYDARYLEAIPAEILERDYGCGDPSRHLEAGESVLDLGSGGGKICYIASQVVGGGGSVVGVDMNDEMLDLAERHRESIGRSLGYHNVSFRKGRIQDLALDYRRVEERLKAHPIHDFEGLASFESWSRERRRRDPMIADDSIDVIVSNCVLNLVDLDDRTMLFREMHRVLRADGRAVISDIVSDREVPDALAADPELWSGCISGAFREDRFLDAFRSAGFRQVDVIERDETPWRVVEGIEFRSVTVRALKTARDASAEAPCCGPSGTCD